MILPWSCPPNRFGGLAGGGGRPRCSGAPDVLVLAAGGIADGRGLAASLMLGADGVLMGTRFWATQEALVPDAAKAKVLQATGDETIRTSVYDIVRQRFWRLFLQSSGSYF